MPLIDELKKNADLWHKNFQADKVVRNLFPMNKPLTVLCCMDHRVIPEKILGLGVGDAEVIRNGGGRFMPSLLPSFVITQDFCKSKIIIVIHHNDCGACHLGKAEDKVLKEYKDIGVDLSEAFQNFSPITDVDESVKEDVKKLRELPMVRSDVAIYGFAYDVDTGELKQVVHDPATTGVEP